LIAPLNISTAISLAGLSTGQHIAKKRTNINFEATSLFFKCQALSRAGLKNYKQDLPVVELPINSGEAF